MTDLSNVPLSDLEKEVEKRKRATENAPVPLDTPDFTVLRNTVIRGVQDEILRQAPDDDLKQYVYEEAMTAVYGPAYFEWRNKQDW